MFASRTVFVVAFVLTGCATSPPVSSPDAPVPALFVDHYAQALVRGEPVYRIETPHSEILIRAYRGGTLGRFGHDHIISGRDLRGYIALADDVRLARVDVYQPLETMHIDEPAKRAQMGFDTQPSARDIEGTRRNMLDKVLETERYPLVSLRVTGASGELPRLTLNVALTLHGVTREIPVEVSVDRADSEGIEVRGRFSINQTDFGVTPFAVLGGALRVQNRLDVDLDVRAVRVPPGGSLPPA